MTVPYLDRIVAAHRETAKADTRRLDDLLEQARLCPPARGFRVRLAATEGVSVIAEIKRRSPSKGSLNVDLRPDATARQYEAGGAACLSVLTDEDWFGGSVADLQQARAATQMPALRKDFTVDARDVLDARIMGADCVLLIAAALSDEELGRFLALARSVGLDALVEVNDAPEVARALEAGADLVGVNQRDLVTFEVDHHRAASLAPLIGGSVVRVAESGIGGPADLGRLAEAGYDAVLVGESLVRSADPAAAVAALVEAGGRS